MHLIPLGLQVKILLVFFKNGNPENKRSSVTVFLENSHRV